MRHPIRREGLRRADRTKLIPHVDYLEKELPFFSEYEKEVDWKVYQSQRAKRLGKPPPVFRLMGSLSSTFQDTPQLCCGDEPSHYKIVQGEWHRIIFPRGLIPRRKVLDLFLKKKVVEVRILIIYT